jgi:glycosyltransferase involved in cell wall biosynthesis
MTTPNVAVVIPSYNHSQYIEQTLASVFRQTLRPQEVHVIDDGSTDDSLRVIERAFAGAGPIRCSLTARENRGISKTRNELYAATTTDFVAFLDSDDLYAPRRLQRMLEGAPHGGMYFAFSGINCMSELGRVKLDDWHDDYHLMLGQGMSFPTAGFALLRSNIAITASNFVVSRGLFDAVGGFDDRIKICQDWDFAVQALRFVEPTFIPEPLLTYRIHSRNTSRKVQKAATWEWDLVIDKLCEWILQPTPNSRAPTSRNWPRYFRIFAHLITSGAGRALAAQFPPEVLAASSQTATAARETKAIRDLIFAARFPESIQELSRNELMLRCRQTWAGLS